MTIDNRIISIIKTRKISEQSHLQQILKEQGFEIPQATLSRKLKKLKIVKILGTYSILGENLNTLPTILNIQTSEHGMIVLHTQPGHAGSLSYFFDQEFVNYSKEDNKNSGIIGTIGGDDTVLLILKSKNETQKVMLLIFERFPYLK
jgi:transcriptional regulator of arginine metabolism